MIDTHHLFDVDVHLMSSYLVLPHAGVFSETCACAVANLGSISIKSKPISAETRSLKDMSLKDLTTAFKSSLRDQVYDKFNVSLENMQVYCWSFWVNLGPGKPLAAVGGVGTPYCEEFLASRVWILVSISEPG